MVILALDTSSDFGSVALLRNEEILGEVRLERSLQHSETLFRAVDLLLSGSRTWVEEVDLFVAARGPGSFTGLRVGLAAAEGLAFASGREARAYSTLAALAWQVRGTQGLIVPLMDARRGEVYGASYRSPAGDLRQVTPPRVFEPRDLLESLPAKEEVVFLGPGVKHCMSGIRTRRPWSVHEAELSLARAIGEMAGTAYREPFEPLYLRPPGVIPGAKKRS